MKNIVVSLLIILLFTPLKIYAFEKQEVKFSKCVDGDTAKVILNDEEITLRFLAIDTPETKHPTIGEEPYGKEASDYTCNALKTAKTIEIEYDENADILDKYNRHLIWIFADNELLQLKLVENGLAEVAYLYDDYKYTNTLENAQIIAKKNNLGIWSTEEKNPIYFYITVALIIFIFIFSKKYRYKIIKKVKKSL